MSKALAGALEQRTQRDPAIGRDMVKNAAGGYVFEIDEWARLDRFLILGTDGGTYYVNERKHTEAAVGAVLALIKKDGPRVVRRAAHISLTGRAPRNDQAIFVLALCAASEDDETRTQALVTLPKVCRIGTHLFQFIRYLRALRGFGRSIKTWVGHWYLSQSPQRLAMQVSKYRGRHGWSHRKLLRMIRPKPNSPVVSEILRFAVHYGYDKGFKVNEDVSGVADSAVHHLANFVRLQQVADDHEAAEVIRQCPKLTHEMVPTHAKGPLAWAALLENWIPMTALIRNLPTLTRHGLVKPLSDGELVVRGRFADAEEVKRARIHPIQALIATSTYASGRSVMGSGVWQPNPRIVEALGDLFYRAFGNLPSISKRVYIGVDVSSSMNRPIPGYVGLSAAQGAAAMAMCLTKQADRSVVFGFSEDAGGRYRWGRPKMKALNISHRNQLADALRTVERMNFGRTDCALPMNHAIEQGIEADAFVILTDNETWFGDVHPYRALQRYRNKTGIPAKLLVLATSGTNHSIADPNDAGMLDVVGFDASVPKIAEDFIKG